MSEKFGKPCPYCHTVIKPTHTTKECPECSAIYHIECWNENKGCSVFGCKQNPLNSIKSNYKEDIPAPVDPNKIYSISINVALAIFIVAVSSIVWGPLLLGCR